MRVPVAALLFVMPLPALAQAGSAGEREMSTDRPDKTESPYTVPGGRVQIELDLANYTRDRSGDVRTETTGAVPFNLKLGLDDATDLQLIVAPYVRQRVTDLSSDTRSKTAGFGDVTVRLKRNLWGNDGGTTAFALMPHVTLPTSRDGLGVDRVEFGIIAPMSIGLSETINLGLMTEIDVVGDDDGGGRDASFVNSATLGFMLTERLGMYTELFTERGDQWVVTGDLGVTYAVVEDVQLDAGVNIGLNEAADDAMVFVGLSRGF